MSKKNKNFSLKVGAPLPKALGRCADFLKEVKELRLWMEKEIAPIKKRESEINDYLLEELSASDDTGASGLKYKALVKSEKEPTVDDWEKVHDFVHDNDRYDLLAKSVNKKAVKEMWENGKKIPGISKVNVKKLSITKI